MPLGSAPVAIARWGAAALLVTADGRYLMQLCDSNPAIFIPDHWCLFGGSVDPGEPAAATIVRELREELVQRFLDFNQLWAISGESQNVVWMRRSVLATEHAMAAPRRVVDVSIGRKELAQLRSIAQSRSEAAGRVERARMLLAYREDPSFFSVGRALGVHHQTVQRCVERAQTLGVLAALDDAPRPGRAPEITVEARAWLVDLACRKAKDFGYPHELWTTRLLAAHARSHGPVAGHVCLSTLAQGTVCKILDAEDVKPHRVRYYLQRRDPAFSAKMAEVLCVYRQVKVLKKRPPSDAVAIISYDEKPGVQAIGNTAPDLPPEPGVHASFARDHEYKRYGTVTLLAGIDLLSGKIHALVRDRHRSREFVEFLRLLDNAYPTHTAIKVILDNHSAHISKETRCWLEEQRSGRFEFVFTPKHGSWLNLVEGFFSKLTRSVLRHIRVESKQELKDRMIAAIDFFNRHPVVHTWTHKLDRAA